LSTGQTTIQGTLDSIASTTYVVRFSSNPGGTDLEGKKFLGKKSVTTKPGDDPNFPCARSLTLTTSKAPGRFTNATAADPNGSASGCSAPRQVVSQ